MFFGTLDVKKGVSSSVNAILLENASFFIKKSKSSSVTQNITFRENLEAPINEGDIIGTVTYNLDGEIIKSMNIVADKEVKKLTFINMAGKVLNNWFTLLR